MWVSWKIVAASSTKSISAFKVTLFLGQSPDSPCTCSGLRAPWCPHKLGLFYWAVCPRTLLCWNTRVRLCLCGLAPSAQPYFFLLFHHRQHSSIHLLYCYEYALLLSPREFNQLKNSNTMICQPTIIPDKWSNSSLKHCTYHLT